MGEGQIFALAALVVAGPLMTLAAWRDLREMRIPNWLNIAIAIAFVPVALALLPLEEAAWRVAGAAAVFAIGFLLFLSGRMGGGDVKMLAASALWVAPAEVAVALQILALALLAGLAVIMPARLALAGREPALLSLRKGARFPMGVSIGAAMLVFFALKAKGAF